MAPEPIKIEGLRQFVKGLRDMDRDLPKELRKGFNEAAEIVVSGTRAKMPRRTGRAASTVKARSTRTAVRVTEGSNRVPYVPWLDYGGRVGRNNSVKRPFIKEGRYLYPTYFANRDRVRDGAVEALIRVANDAGMGVD